MSTHDAVRQAFRGNVIAVVRGASAEAATRAVDLLVAAGLQLIEVTLTVPGALRVLEQALDRHGDAAMIGAGTVLDVESCRAALLAGARFIVSPTLRPAVIEMAHRYAALSIPGALTATEVLTAWEHGADLVKVFPVDAVGGPRYIRLLKAPLPQIRLVASGGTSPASAPDYFEAGAEVVGIAAYPVGNGSWEEAEANARALAAARPRPAAR